MIPKKIVNPKSKTHWLGYALVGLGAIQTYAPAIQEAIPSNWYGIGTFVVGVLTVVLRSVTTKPIEQK